VPAVGDAELRRLVAEAAAGDRTAAEAVLAAVRDDVYRLALRMLWHPEDAEDATQEALIRILTRLGSYRGEAAFRTWAYRVAANHILNWRQSRVERERLDFRRFGEELSEGLAEPDPAAPDARLLAEEVKLGCTPRDAALPRPGAPAGLRAERRVRTAQSRRRLDLRGHPGRSPQAGQPGPGAAAGVRRRALRAW
jgi:RNA polymerase sigma factor (sigma-70 family)